MMVARPGVLALGILLLGLAGCTDTGGGEGGGNEPDGPVPAPGETGDAAAGPAPAPVWEVGQWWTWEVSAGSSSASYSVTTAVLSAGGATYLVGTSDVDAAARAFPFHLLGLGEVQASDLSWEAHGSQAAWARFPLSDGDTWTHDFWAVQGAEVKATATNLSYGGDHSGFQMDITYPGAPDSLFAQAEYSPRAGQFVRVATYFGGEGPFAEAVLTADGTNATGFVVPFVATELLRHVANGADPGTLAPRQVSISPEADLVILACFLSGDEGVYRASYVPADGEERSCETLNPAATDLSYHVTVQPAAPGSATIVPTAIGEGTANIEFFEVDTGG